VRTQAEMERALEGIGGLRKRAEQASVDGNVEYNPGWHTALDLTNLLTVSEAIARAALERRESRGAHFRDDFPAKDEAFAAFNILIGKAPDGSMQVTREPLPEMSAELRGIIEEMK
jgi:succinate dehydrogenase / fumarate reductase, flavoprotein subunit